MGKKELLKMYKERINTGISFDLKMRIPVTNKPLHAPGPSCIHMCCKQPIELTIHVAFMTIVEMPVTCIPTYMSNHDRGS